MLDLRNKSAKERAKLKGREIAKVKPCQKTTNGIKVQIISLEPIEDGVVAFVKAWKNGNPLGFGKDGSVEIERMIIHNPPILIDSPTGDIIREWEEDDMDGKKVKKTRRLKEDPKAAILEVLTHNVELVGKEGTEIVKGKVGNTTSTFYPTGGATSPCDGQVGASLANPGTTWSAINSTATANSTAVSDASGLNSLTCGFYGANTSDQWRYRVVSFYSFDTSSIADDRIISATLSLFGVGAATPNTITVNVVEGTPASTSTLATGDFYAHGNTALSTGITNTAWNTSDYNDFALNESGIGSIDKSGVSTFTQRTEEDINDSAPTWINNILSGVNNYYADQTGTTSDPKLVVEHDVPLDETTTSLVSSKNPSNFGQSVTFTATIAADEGTPTGDVEFYNGATLLDTVALTAGTAALTIATLSVATHSITASYLGNETYDASVSSAVSQVVAEAIPLPEPPDPPPAPSNATVILYINGIDCTSALVRESISIQEGVGRNAQMNFTLRDVSWIPKENQVVEFYDDGLLFAGRATMVTQVSELPEKRVDIQVTDWFDECMGQLVRSTYDDHTLIEVVQDIVKEKVLDSDLKMMLRFEGDGTDWTDNGNDAVATNGTYNTDSVTLTAGYLTVTHDATLAFTTEFSLCIETDVVADTVILTKGAYRIYTTANRNVVFEVDGEGIITEALSEGSHTIVCTRGDTSRIYVDGVEHTSGILPVAIAGNNNLVIGTFSGDVKRVSCYARTLSSSEARRWHIDGLEVKASSRHMDSPTLPVAQSSFDYVYPAECFSQMCQELEMVWWIDANMFLHFRDKAGQTATAVLEEDDGQSMIQGTVNVVTDKSQIRNVAYVRGGTYPGAWRKDVLQGNGVSVALTLPYRYFSFALLPDTSRSSVQSWYNMQEASGNLADETTTNALTAANLTYQQTGTLGYAIEFNGTTSSARKTSATIPAGDHSITAWIKPDVHDTTERVIAGFGDFAGNMSRLSLVKVGDDYLLRYRFGSSTVDVNTGDLSGAWHLIGVSNDGTASVYLDGELIHSEEVTGAADAGVVEIGGNNGSNVFDGLIDDVVLYDHALSAQQQQGYYLAEESGVLLKTGIDFVHTEGYDVFYNFQEKLIRFDTAPADGEVLYATGTPEVPLLAVRTNQQSIRTYGRREMEVIDDSVGSLDAARKRALAEIAQRKDPRVIITFSTLREFHAGDVITIRAASYDITERDFLIQSVTTVFFLPDAVSSKKHMYSLECVNVLSTDWIDFMRDLYRRGKKTVGGNEVESEDIIDYEESVSIAEVHTIVDPEPHAEAVSVTESHTELLNATGAYKWSNDEETTEDAMRWDLAQWS